MSHPKIEVCSSEQLKRVITHLWDNRLDFAKEIVGMKPTDQQAEALIAMDSHDEVAHKAGHGIGKAQPKNIEVDTPSGKRKWGDLYPGDYLFGVDGKPVKILFRHEQGVKKTFLVKFDDGSSTVCCGEHIWSVKGRNERRTKKDFVNLSTLDIYKSGVFRKNGVGQAKKYEIPVHGPVCYREKDIPLDPYILGLWLGDGGRKSGRITTGDKEIVDRIKGRGFSVGISLKKGTTAVSVLVHKISKKLRVLGIFEKYSYEKSVPKIYLENSVKVRLDVLRGLMDTDGYVNKNGSIIFYSTSKELAENVVWLSRSLGGKARISDSIKKPFYHSKNGDKVFCRYCYSVVISMPAGIEIFYLNRKKLRTKKNYQNRYLKRWISAIEPAPEQDCMCVTVDSMDGLYLTNDFITTHNSAISAALILHYMSCRPFPKIPCTAPSRHQLHDVLWSELSKWHRSMKSSDVGRMFSDMFVWQKEKFFHRDHPEEWFAAARTATKENPEALQGFHADYILKITDEASAIPEDVFDVLEGAHGMQETKLYMPGNPTRLDGTFYNAFNKSRDFYYRISSSAIDSPIVPANYAMKMASKYGKDSNIYRIRVLGEFPKQDGDSYIPFDLVQAALVREVEDDLSYPLVLGVDVARFGDDDTVILPRRGNKTYEYKILRHKDTMATVGEVARMANKLKANMIFIDVIGVGAGVYDRLAQLGYPVTPVNAAESPATQPDLYRKQRDELWGKCRDWLETKCVRLWDNEAGDLAGELTTPKYSIPNGKIVIESKDEMKKRGVASPNIADALNLTFALPSSEIMPIDIGPLDSVQSEQPFDSEAGY